MATILDPKTGDAWEIVGGVWRKVRSGSHGKPQPPRAEIAKVCAHPECGQAFDGAAFRGFRTGKLYCSRLHRAEMSDEAGPEDLARHVN